MKTSRKRKAKVGCWRIKTTVPMPTLATWVFAHVAASAASGTQFFQESFEDNLGAVCFLSLTQCVRKPCRSFKKMTNSKNEEKILMMIACMDEDRPNFQ